MEKSNNEHLEEDTNFSFSDHSSLFEPLLLSHNLRNNIVEDIKDFWKFVNKYESILKKKAGGQTISKMAHKMNGIAVRLNEDECNKNITHQMYKSKSDEEPVTVLRAKQFQEIIAIYLDFKQKEKFLKIKKLRNSQKTLPMWKFKVDLKEALNETNVLIIAGDTGCGKSTQVPQYLYEFGYRSIACTQPRRLACIALSKRVAYEMLDDYDSKVGFQIRFEKNKTQNTNILFITEGLLLRQLALESNLEHYDVLILDEIHERNLFGDFLLGVTKCLLRAKPKLKLILMSATINVNLFYNYFKDEGAKLLQVPGRLYPIKTVHMPPPSLELQAKTSGHSQQTSGRLDPAPFVQVLNLIDEKYSTSERGDVLIFVSGVNEITTVCDAIKEYAEQQSHWIILPLHSGLSLAEQDRVFDFAPEGMRKCIVCTNIAETSLTVDGIRFVVDSGKVKEMSYDNSCKGQRLKEFWVSKSSAEQRKGRAGRTGPGICYRLFSEKQYDAFESYPTPEILRVPLDTILLQMISMGLPDVRRFPFIESPGEESIEHTILGLKQHSTLTSDEKITALGKVLSNLPVEISIGKMLMMSCVFPQAVEKILTLAALNSVQNPLTNRAYTDTKCEEARSSLESNQGDIFTLFALYYQWLKLKCDRENTRKWCYKLGIEEQRFYEITKVRNQFQNILESCNVAPKSANKNLTNAERAKRHGEVRVLKAIKRKQKNQEPRKRKVLKFNTNDDDADLDNADDDIRDVDFRLYNDAAKLAVLLHSAKIDKLRDVVLLKLIIVSGFYPQIALNDEFNYCKSGSQQFFHTFLKPFVSIHPNSYFAKYFDLLRLKDSDILTKPSYYTPKQSLSEAHQVVCYQNLLETAKPYLVNCLRMPAAQCLLLFSYKIDTNAAISRVVCDSWLCLDFPNADVGCKLLCDAIKLRRLWNKLLMDKLTDLEVNIVKDTERAEKKYFEDLYHDLINFMSVNEAFTIKRLLPADLKNLYTQKPLNDINNSKINPFAKDFDLEPNNEKGGINISENVVYNCLQQQQWAINMDNELAQSMWSCSYCGTEMEYNAVNKLLHKSTCQKHKEIYKTKCESTPTISYASGSSQNKATSFHCTTCLRHLHLSQIDILKHKRTCK